MSMAIRYIEYKDDFQDSIYPYTPRQNIPWNNGQRKPLIQGIQFQYKFLEMYNINQLGFNDSEQEWTWYSGLHFHNYSSLTWSDFNI